MSETSHLSRRNAYHFTVRRSASSSSTSSSLSSSSTFSNSSTPRDSSDDDPVYRTPSRAPLLLKATEINKKASKIEQARERRRLERQKLEEEGEWRTGCAILASEQLFNSERELWKLGDEHLGLVGSKLADQQFNIASLTPTSRIHLPLVSSPPPTPSLQPNSPPAIKSSSTPRPPLYPLLIPSQPSERPRSLQPLPRISEGQTLESSDSRRHSWTGGSRFEENLGLGPLERWGTEEVISWLKTKGFGARVVQVFEDNSVSGSQLLQLDLERLKEIGIGTRFRLVESIRDLFAAVTPSPSAYLQPQSPDASPALPPDSSSPETPRPSQPPKFDLLITSTHSSLTDSPSIYSVQTLTPTRSESESESSTPIQRQPPTPAFPITSLPPRRRLNSSPPLPPPKLIPSYPEIDLQGTLQVRCTRSGKQEERWCVLERGIGELLFFESRSNPKPIQTLPLQGYKIVSIFDPSPSPSSSTSQPSSPSPNQTTFSFHLLHRRSPTWYFVASSESSAHAWMKALIKGTVERDYNTAVWSSLTSEVIPLSDAQEKYRGCMLPEELREERKRRKSTERTSTATSISQRGVGLVV